MSYATGSYTSVGGGLSATGALDLFAAWAVTNGWIQNNLSVDGTGKRLHIQKTIGGTNFFFNLRTATTSIAFGSVAASNCMFVNGATKFDLADAWDKQGEATTGGFTTNYYGASASGVGVVESLKTGGGTCHFFATSTNLTAVFETDSTQLDWRMVTVGSLGGYPAYFSSGGELSSSYNATYGDARSAYCCPTYQGSGSFSNPDNQASIFVPGEGWYGMAQYSTSTRTMCPLVSKRPVQQALDGSVAAPTVKYSPDSFRGNAQLAPSTVMIVKGISGEYYPVADIEGVKFINMKNYTNGQEITYDGDTYKLFRINNAAETGVAFLK